MSRSRIWAKSKPAGTGMATGIYTSIGDSGNITPELDTERMKIWTFDLQGQDKRLFASGLRNTEKQS